jgi:DNA-binding response OmpR family regulator
MKCPCCGGDIYGDRLLVSLDWNVLIFREHVVCVPGKLAEIAHILAADMPGAVNVDRIMAMLYARNPPRSDVRALHNHIRRLRNVLPEGLELVTVLGGGYALRRTTRGAEHERTRHDQG